MSEVILQKDYDVSQVSPDVCVLSPSSALSSALSDSFPAPLQSVISNMNRHIKIQRRQGYQEWNAELNHVINKNQKKITDVFLKNDGIRRKSSASKSVYNVNHSRQIQLSKSIVQNLIIDFGLPLSIVEHEAFNRFMNTIDPKFTMTSRRTLSRTTILRLYDIMNDELKKFLTDNAANNIKAFENLIIAGFQNHFDIEDNDNDDEGSDINVDDVNDGDNEELSIQVRDNDDTDIIELIKHSFHSIAANSEALHIPCFAHTIQLIANDGLKQISSIQTALSKVSKIAKLSHTSIIFSEKLENIGKSIHKANGSFSKDIQSFL
ncbi:unnamed protein product [Rotaria sp. Silwood1]|nr:unnamed protein product [Rotaria sp. Silwood1]CAF3898618.1 unnamed protein product [Rotaria sp. Silwood1]CAF4036363.1 unnamed protein product [Rotaria sp. Silwood1]